VDAAAASLLAPYDKPTDSDAADNATLESALQRLAEATLSENEDALESEGIAQSLLMLTEKTVVEKPLETAKKKPKAKGAKGEKTTKDIRTCSS
jgi:hypothetical protein